MTQHGSEGMELASRANLRKWMAVKAVNAASQNTEPDGVNPKRERLSFAFAAIACRWLLIAFSQATLLLSTSVVKSIGRGMAIDRPSHNSA
jgi:hypothetical protein